VVIPFRMAMVLYALFWGALAGAVLLFGNHDTDFGWVYLGLAVFALLRAVQPYRAPRPPRHLLGSWWPPSKDPGDYR
jgi:hypothetical protein